MYEMASEYRVLADYRDPRQAAYRGPIEGFTEAADRAAEMASRDRNSLRVVVIERCRDGVIVAAHSMPVDGH